MLIQVHTTRGCGEQGFPSAQPYLSPLIYAANSRGALKIKIEKKKCLRRALNKRIALAALRGFTYESNSANLEIFCGGLYCNKKKTSFTEDYLSKFYQLHFEIGARNLSLPSSEHLILGMNFVFWVIVHGIANGAFKGLSTIAEVLNAKPPKGRESYTLK
ncbi:hypothetical protein N7508_009908 [Penicillium antarcticum]|uniref:uncharacterized protein n=1 Tax=Penicillium antarcticum TaxID=416450 RepID=UPI0023970388|nr:uncharacterized protein N7508_009908 [Penicillium antarcticum]KAJ5295087.1 hypothetical protein N7508_009908 [Penicillium antarcticum]